MAAALAAAAPAAAAPVATAPTVQVPTIADNTPALGNLFQTYDPGSPSSLFAPAFIHGYKPSEDALAAWNATNHPITRDDVDALRMPNVYTPPSPKTAADGVYGAGVPINQMYGDARGAVDPAALRVLAQGGQYNVGARRDAIAARLAQNAALQAIPAPAPADPQAGMKFIFD